MAVKDIIDEGQKTTKELTEKAKEGLGKASETVDKGLKDHGIDAEKLGNALLNDVKSAGHFVVGGAKIAADKVKSATASSDPVQDIVTEAQEVREGIIHTDVPSDAHALTREPVATSVPAPETEVMPAPTEPTE